MEITVIDLQLIQDSLPALLHGASLSLQIAFIACVIGFTMGTVIAFGETSKKRLIRWPIALYVNFFRGTPMLVQILFVFYVLPELGVTISPFWTATLAIGLNSSAYVSQIIRSGINAVSTGQIEAAYALGFSRFMTMRYIVFPQAFKTVLPSLGNEFVTLIKDSSLASIIGVMELSKEASIIRSRTYDAFSIFLAVSIIYLILTGLLSFGIHKLEQAMNKDV